MLGSELLSTVHAAVADVLYITQDHLSSYLNAVACLSVAADHLHPFMNTVHPPSDRCF